MKKSRETLGQDQNEKVHKLTAQLKPGDSVLCWPKITGVCGVALQKLAQDVKKSLDLCRGISDLFVPLFLLLSLLFPPYLQPYLLQYEITVQPVLPLSPYPIHSLPLLSPPQS